MCKLHKNIVRIAVYRVEKFINFIKKKSLKSSSFVWHKYRPNHTDKGNDLTSMIIFRTLGLD